MPCKMNPTQKGLWHQINQSSKSLENSMDSESTRWLRDGLKGLVCVRDSYENRTGMYRMGRNERPVSKTFRKHLIGGYLQIAWQAVPCI